ncbi:hypothetical protein HYPSUDRAFT_57207 [Hypholoma sublateritium FD-334 SS-4]|uniref:Uncharacterized protein n=1 Tax=Hypholoma sublateritium (strain FD-334 SS-4) TaxID=945553 RepID=A0A0D2M599_HYPSF|nr:hypothetical protein HYPSUDRAFT_57207 [Hypholoma sublateritium FD-334 SS-4]
MFLELTAYPPFTTAFIVVNGEADVPQFQTIRTVRLVEHRLRMRLIKDGSGRGDHVTGGGGAAAAAFQSTRGRVCLSVPGRTLIVVHSIVLWPWKADVSVSTDGMNRRSPVSPASTASTSTASRGCTLSMPGAQINILVDAPVFAAWCNNRIYIFDEEEIAHDSELVVLQAHNLVCVSTMRLMDEQHSGNKNHSSKLSALENHGQGGLPLPDSGLELGSLIEHIPITAARARAGAEKGLTKGIWGASCLFPRALRKWQVAQTRDACEQIGKLLSLLGSVEGKSGSLLGGVRRDRERRLGDGHPDSKHGAHDRKQRQWMVVKATWEAVSTRRSPRKMKAKGGGGRWKEVSERMTSDIGRGVSVGPHFSRAMCSDVPGRAAGVEQVGKSSHGDFVGSVAPDASPASSRGFGAGLTDQLRVDEYIIEAQAVAVTGNGQISSGSSDLTGKCTVQVGISEDLTMGS